MKWLAAALLIGVAVRHMASGWLASFFGMPVAGMFYVLGGLWEVTLASAMLLLLLGQKPSLYLRMARAAMMISILEGLQISTCRMAIGNMAQVPKGANLCDYATGLPVGAVMVAMYVIIIFWSLKR